MACERDMSKLDVIAKRSASSGSSKFTGKEIRDEMMLYKSGPVIVQRSTLNIAKVLDERECNWMREKDKLDDARLAELREAADKSESLKNTLPLECKF